MRRTTLSGRRLPQDDEQPKALLAFQRRILLGLNMTGTAGHIYGGTARSATAKARKAARHRAKAARRHNRRK